MSMSQEEIEALMNGLDIADDEQENEELKKTIKEKEKDKNITTKDELVAKKQEIEKLKADQDEKSKKIFVFERDEGKRKKACPHPF